MRAIRNGIVPRLARSLLSQRQSKGHRSLTANAVRVSRYVPIAATMHGPWVQKSGAIGWGNCMFESRP